MCKWFITPATSTVLTTVQTLESDHFVCVRQKAAAENASPEVIIINLKNNNSIKSNNNNTNNTSSSSNLSGKQNGPGTHQLELHPQRPAHLCPANNNSSSTSAISAKAYTRGLTISHAI